MLLPKKVGNFTLMRRLRSDGITESFAAILDDPAGRQVTARRLLPHVLRDRAQLREIEGRARQLVEVRHPVVVPVLDYVEVAEDRYLLEQWVDAVPLTTLLDHLRESGSTLPHNVFLNLSTQICNGLEALHARTGGESDPVLHTGLCPSSVLLQRTGKVIIGDFGLVRSPTASPGRGGGEAVTSRLEYLSPEQTHPEQRLSPASDIFSLGTVLYEMLTLKPMFRSKSNLQTIHRVRRAEVTSHLLEVKEILPGVDRVLYRALSLNPRHRYQRAFVLREDLRGLMAGFSFARIEEETQAVLAPLFMTRGAESMEDVLLDRPPDVGETTASLIAAPLSAPVAVPTLDRMAPPLGVAAPTPRTLIPTDDSEMLDRPEEGAFESEESTDIRDPADLPNRQPTMPLEVEDLDATEEPGSVDDADEEDGGAEPSPPEDGTSWFPRVPAGSSDPSEGVTEHAPVSLMANPIDPDALAADTEATTLREDFDTVAFEDEVNTEVKATPAPLASPDAKPAPAAGQKGEAGKSGSRKRRRKKKRRGRRAAGAASSQSAEANSPPAAKPPPRPAPAPVAAKTDTPVPRPAAADDDLDWRQDRGGGGWMLGIGAVVGVLALSVVLCIGLGGTGALLGASSVDNASTALATPDPEPPGRLPPAPKPAEAPEDPGLSEPTIAERPEPEPEPERPAAPRPAPAVAVQPAPAPQPPPRPRVAPVAPRPAPAVA
ncbi:MAG: serine/threonine protein kinase, partial [Myxococcota bacterium]